MPITSDTMLSRTSDVRHATVDTKETVLLNIAAGECYALNAVGSRIWELLEQPMTVGQLCMKIREEFEIDVHTCDAAVLKFANEIIDIGMLNASNP